MNEGENEKVTKEQEIIKSEIPDLKKNQRTSNIKKYILK